MEVLAAMPPQVPAMPVGVSVSPGGEVGRAMDNTIPEADAGLLLVIVTRNCASTPVATDAGVNTAATLNGGTLIIIVATTCGAAEKPAPPAWLAVRLHVPTPTKVTVAPIKVQTLAGLVLPNTTGLPEPPPVAVKPKGAAPNSTLDGGAKLLIVCGNSAAVMMMLAVTGDATA